MFENLLDELPYNFYIMICGSLTSYTQIAVHASTFVLSDNIHIFKKYPTETADKFKHIADLYPSATLDECNLLFIESKLEYDCTLNNIKVIKVDDTTYITELNIISLDEYFRTIT